MEIQLRVAWFKLVFLFLPNFIPIMLSTYILREIMNLPYFYIMTKSKVGVDFDVPHDVPPEGNTKIHFQLALNYWDPLGNKMRTLIYHVHVYWLWHICAMQYCNTQILLLVTLKIWNLQYVKYPYVVPEAFPFA